MIELSLVFETGFKKLLTMKLIYTFQHRKQICSEHDWTGLIWLKCINICANQCSDCMNTFHFSIHPAASEIFCHFFIHWCFQELLPNKDPDNRDRALTDLHNFFFCAFVDRRKIGDNCSISPGAGNIGFG